MTRIAYRYPNGAIASPHYLATLNGLHVLMDGGNAVDAAVACAAVLAVTTPHLNGVGGDLFAIVYTDGEVIGLNASGRLPAAAKLPENGKVPVFGVGSATVPGAISGWQALLERFGTRSIKELVRPAIQYAREGLWRSPGLVQSTERSRPLLEGDPEAARTFLVDGPLVQKELADTLEDVENFYAGRCSENAPPPFTRDDFVSHRADWVEPMRTRFQGVEVLEMPPNSRGHLALRAIERMESLEGLTDADPEFHMRMIRALDSATEQGDTVYFCVADGNGMAVSVNQSNFMGFGSGVMIPGTGVHLHNRGAYFTPETYIGGERPIHTLSPAMALQDGAPKLVFGTMGGEAQIQIHLQLLARIFVMGLDPAEAVSRPRWVKRSEKTAGLIQSSPMKSEAVATVLVEEGLPDLGGVPMPDPSGAGHAHMILTTEEGFAPASDPRCDGLAAGY